jgi:hypothetical protein
MKIISSNKAKQMSITTVIIVLLIIVLFSLFANFIDIKAVATALNINKYEIRSDLLIAAMDNVGVCKPEDAAIVWSNGLKMRSAAMQYSVMTKKLKTEYAAQLEEGFSNWVTGMSSPWVDSFKIAKSDKLNDNIYTFNVVFSTMTSTGPAGDYNAKLNVIKEKDFWRISNIVMDNELYPYTGFNLS